MTDAEIEILLRSDASLVVIEAPAGCGKTYQAASYAADVADKLGCGKVLVLTHTHAACSVVAERTSSIKNKVQIQTLDSLINQIATAYRNSIGLPDDVALWTRKTKNGYEILASKVTKLLDANPMICRHLAKLFPVIICDEHQDSSQDQNQIVQLIRNHGSLLRIFGDPMQIIPGGNGQERKTNEALRRWNETIELGTYGNLETPHRWTETDPVLGAWIQEARNSLQQNGFIDLTADLPEAVKVFYAEDISPTPINYLLRPANSRGLAVIIGRDMHSLFISATGICVEGVHRYFGRQFPIWEGYTRKALEKFVEALAQDKSNEEVTADFITFLKTVLTGFTSAMGDRLVSEINKPTINPRGNLPPRLKSMAEKINEAPGHKGFCLAAAYLKNLIKNNVAGFADIQIDYPSELSDLIKLQPFKDPQEGFAEITQRRSRSYPKPPNKAASTIHKAKGLEAENVVVFACDQQRFQNTQTKKNLLYVALSRSTRNVTLVVSSDNPTQLLRLN